MIHLMIIIVATMLQVAYATDPTCSPLTAGNSLFATDLAPLVTAITTKNTSVADIDAKIKLLQPFLEIPPAMDKCIGSMQINVGGLLSVAAKCSSLASHPAVPVMMKLAAEFTESVKGQVTPMQKIPYGLNWLRSVQDKQFAKVCGLVTSDLQQCILGELFPYLEKVIDDHSCCVDMVKDSEKKFQLKPAAFFHKVFDLIAHIACDTQEKYPKEAVTSGQQTCLYTAVQSFVPKFNVSKNVTMMDMMMKTMPLIELAQIQNAGGCDAFNGGKYLKAKTVAKVNAYPFVDGKVYSGCSTTMDNVMSWIRALPVLKETMVGDKKNVPALDLFEDKKAVSATQFMNMLKKIVPEQYHPYLGAVSMINFHFSNGFAAKCDFVSKHSVVKFVEKEPETTKSPAKKTTNATPTPEKTNRQTTVPPSPSPTQTKPSSAAITGLSTALFAVYALAFFN